MKKTFLSALLALAAFTAGAQTQKETLQVAFTGDIMMGTTFPSVQLPPQEGRQLFVAAAPILRQADVAAGNLEGTLCDSGKTHKKVSKVCYAFRTPTSYAPLLQQAGYDFLSMANNHANDFGADGIASTRRCLDQLGIAHAGIQGYEPAVVVERDGVRYGFCAFGHNGYTVRHQDLGQVRQIVTSLVNQCDIVIVSFHGGAEGSSRARLPYGKETFCGEDRGSLREFAHFCIDAGADVVYGHGPHVARAVELYKEHFIAYSLGNFCTPYGMSLGGVLGYAPLLTLELTRDGRFVSGQIHSFIQAKGVGPRLAASHRAAREIRRLTALDVPGTPLVIDDEGHIRRK